MELEDDVAATASPGLTRHTTPAASETGSSFRARPAPSRQAHTPTARASRRVNTPVRSARTYSTSGAVAIGASGSPPWAHTISRHTGRARPDVRTTAGSSHAMPASSTISRASATVTSTRSAGPPPASVSTDSVTSSPLPAARPSTVSIAVCNAAVRTPFAAPSATIVSARRRPSSGSGRNAPAPNLTSSTSASVPSAIFFDMIDDAISGMDSTVPVTSRSAYNLRSAGTRPGPAAAMTPPTDCNTAIISAGVSSARHPAMASILSSVPPVWPSPRPESCGTAAPHAATSGTSTS